MRSISRVFAQRLAIFVCALAVGCLCAAPREANATAVAALPSSVTPLFVCRLLIPLDARRTETIPTEVFGPEDSSSLSMRFPMPDGILRRVKVSTSALTPAELLAVFDEVLATLRQPSCLASRSCRAYANRIEKLFSPPLQAIRESGATVVVYEASPAEPFAPTLYQVKDEASESIATLGTRGWGQVGICGHDTH